jgi:hypothetical protein
MKTFDGPALEQERFLNITDTLNRIDLNEKEFKWGFCHFFQSYSPVNLVWTFIDIKSGVGVLVGLAVGFYSYCKKGY